MTGLSKPALIALAEAGLGRALAAQGRHQEARPFLERGREGLRATLPHGRFYLKKLAPLSADR